MAGAGTALERIAYATMARETLRLLIEGGAVVLVGHRPVKIGAGAELVDLGAGLGLPPERIKAAIGWHCRRIEYLEALASEGAMRHDLQGEPVEAVSDEHRAEALAAVARREEVRRPTAAAVKSDPAAAPGAGGKVDPQGGEAHRQADPQGGEPHRPTGVNAETRAAGKAGPQGGAAPRPTGVNAAKPRLTLNLRRIA